MRIHRLAFARYENPMQSRKFSETSAKGINGTASKNDQQVRLLCPLCYCMLSSIWRK